MEETKNLILRNFRIDDAGFLYEIQCDSEAMKFTYCSRSLQETQTRLNTYAMQLDLLGYAPWTILSKEDKKIIGWGGLNIDPFVSGWGTEVAYFFHPGYWGHGYATELVKASIENGFVQLDLHEINAYAHAGNFASIRVLEKCGFMFKRYVSKLDRNHYQIENK